MAYEDNAAGRLHNVLAAFRSANRSLGVGTAWSSALQTPEANRAEILAGIATLHRLAAQAESEIRALGIEDADMLLEWVEPVRQFLLHGHQLETQVAAIVPMIEAHHMTTLSFAARELHARMPDRQLSDDDRERALELVSELLAVLRDTDDLNATDRDMLLRHASALQHALNATWLSGTSAVRDALAAALGAALVVSTEHPKARETSAFKRFVDVVQKVGAVLLVAESGLAIGNGVVGLIGG